MNRKWISALWHRPVPGLVTKISGNKTSKKTSCMTAVFPALLLAISVCIPTVLVIFLLAPYGWGQAVSATLVGTVTDQTGAAVPKVQVTIQETTTGIVHQSVTNGSGNYTFPDLTPGVYSVTAEAAGFRKGKAGQRRCGRQHDAARGFFLASR